MSGSEILSLRGAAKIAAVSHETVRQWCEKGVLGQRVGDRWHIPKTDLNRILRARRVLGK